MLIVDPISWLGGLVKLQIIFVQCVFNASENIGKVVRQIYNEFEKDFAKREYKVYKEVENEKGLTAR